MAYFFKLIVFLGILFTHLTVVSQVSGYLGKRFSVKAYTMGLPFKSMINENSNFEENGEVYYRYLPDMNLKYGIDIEYTLSKKGMVGLELEMISDYLTFSSIQPNPNSFIGGYSDMDELGAIYGFSYGVSYKIFNSNSDYIAPIGSFFVFKLMEHRFKFIDNGTFLGEGNEVISSFKNHSINFGFGKQSVYFNHLLASYTWSFGMDIENSLQVINHWRGKAYLSPITMDVYKKRFVDNIVNFKVGIGWLLF